MNGGEFGRKPELKSTMEDSRASQKLSEFFDSGFYRFEESNSVFIDPVRVLNRSYARFRVSAHSYYSRFFEPKLKETTQQCSESRKRKRSAENKKPHVLNERERTADLRHQEARPLLLKACESLLGAKELLGVMRDLRDGSGSPVSKAGESSSGSAQSSLLELGGVWQSSLCEITLRFSQSDGSSEDGDDPTMQRRVQVIPAFNNLVFNDSDEEVEAECMNLRYILPRDSCFYMSDLKQVHSLIPAENNSGYNLIVIDPPWENGSARQKWRYPTLPNKHFLFLPIKQLSHKEGALVALWVTNREKLRRFVVEELFPAWGVNYSATFYWLKVKPDGSLVSDLDLFHHRPYECLILGHCHGEVIKSDSASRIKAIPDNQIIISIPGDYSRKPPIGGVLEEYIGGHSRIRGLELFAREMVSGWVSWGNEPLHFQDSTFFHNPQQES